LPPALAQYPEMFACPAVSTATHPSIHPSIHGRRADYVSHHPAKRRGMQNLYCPAGNNHLPSDCISGRLFYERLYPALRPDIEQTGNNDTLFERKTRSSCLFSLHRPLGGGCVWTRHIYALFGHVCTQVHDQPIAVLLPWFRK
jgi:hypothetical protein